MRILITAGPTREYFDSVRFLSNASSGEMGFAIASEAVRRGHEVILIAGPVELPPPRGPRVISVVSAEEMYGACKRHFADCDAAIMTAAVCDYRPARKLSHKLKKTSRTRTVELKPTTDICAALGAIKGDRVVIGFALEDRNPRQNAQRKLRRKRCDAIVLNHVRTLGSESARVELLRADTGWSRPLRGGKSRIAGAVVDLVESLTAQRP